MCVSVGGGGGGGGEWRTFVVDEGTSDLSIFFRS